MRTNEVMVPIGRRVPRTAFAEFPFTVAISVARHGTDAPGRAANPITVDHEDVTGQRRHRSLADGAVVALGPVADY